ncbi:MmcQ/YjbR family DNA-binding protein [Nocardioides jensenii]|uniref:MmcQ/YjbR family DNA-binding protein n=1 Tax=Nocardioides jensenii TaxID=1843 RepID=UPI000A63945F|nr:MmcQ/YjbR family DNA-binding protein [Nocardioides jensenii]
MTRMATPDDIALICNALPQVEFGTSWGDRPTFKVPRGEKGKGFLLYRMPHKTAVDPETGEMYDDLLVIHTQTLEDKEALIADERLPFFTIEHFNGFRAVLVQESRLGEIDLDELTEIITDAWAAKAPKRLAKEFFAERSTDG